MDNLNNYSAQTSDARLFFFPNSPSSHVYEHGPNGEAIKGTFLPSGVVLLQGRIVAAPSQFLIENVWRLLFSGRTFKKIITRVINATLAVRLLMFLFYVCFCTQHPLASIAYVRVRIFALTDRVFIMPSVSICQVSGSKIFSRYEIFDIEISQCILHWHGYKWNSRSERYQ